MLTQILCIDFILWLLKLIVSSYQNCSKRFMHFIGNNCLSIDYKVSKRIVSHHKYFTKVIVSFLYYL